MSVQLPIIDFAALAADKSDEEISECDFSALGEKLIDIFSSIGFVYLSHHGVSAELLDSAVRESGTFFQLPTSVKDKYARDADTNIGWLKVEQESLNPERPGDIKESFNVTSAAAQKKSSMPNEEVPNLGKLSFDLMASCGRLSDRILRAMGTGLKLENPNFFVEQHTDSALTTMRYLYYPQVTEETKPGQIRCGEHSDYGSITLLFQDNMGGLQVLSKAGEWLNAVPVDGAILVNIGDLMQRWTSDKLVSTKHRVVIPEAETKKRQARRSTAYFVHPTGDALITCIDGSNKYEPITSLDYINMRFGVTY